MQCEFYRRVQREENPEYIIDTMDDPEIRRKISTS